MIFSNFRLCKSGAQSCDNCRNSSEKRDVTAFAKSVLSGVEEILKRDGWGGNITVNQLVDILRGSKNEKTKKCGWDNTTIYGQGKPFPLKVIIK